MRDPEAIGKIRAHIRTLLAITASRTEYLVRNNTVPSRPVAPIRIHQPVEYKRWWRVVLANDKVQYANLTITFADDETWDLREGAQKYV